MNDSETVAEIVAMLRRFAKGAELPTDEFPSFTSLADSIEAAHRREVAELQGCLKEAVRLHCDNLDGDCLHCIRCGVCDYLKWREVLAKAAGEEVK